MKLLPTLVASTLITFASAAAAVNVNKASAEEIANALTGIGPSKAQAIVKLCQSKKSQPCRSAEDLLQIKGIGEKTLKKIKKDVSFK